MAASEEEGGQTKEPSHQKKDRRYSQINAGRQKLRAETNKSAHEHEKTETSRVHQINLGNSRSQKQTSRPSLFEKRPSMLLKIKYQSLEQAVEAESLADLRKAIERESNLESDSQKLISKGKTINSEDQFNALKEGATLTLLGTPKAVVDGVQAELSTWKRRQQLRSEPTVKVRSTSRFADISTNKTRFASITPFPESAACPHHQQRLACLQRIAEDPAILHLMQEHDLVVGDLTELHPHKDPTLLGLNKNAGQQICLRILTDALDGIRPYSGIRRVMIHELAHNRHGPHGLDFKEFDSKMAKQVVAFENDPERKGHRLGGDIEKAFEPELAKALLDGRCDATGGPPVSLGQRLGGSSLPLAGADSPEERRRQAADAAAQRARPA